MPMIPVAAVATALTLVLIVILYQKPARHLPPGPPKVPFFGNLFQVTSLRPHPQFLVWARKYGPIFHLRLGPQNMIVLNSAEAADELFVSRGNIYSTRVSPHVAHDIVSAGQRMVFLPYGKEFKAVKKSMQTFIGPGSSKKIRPIQDMESRVLLYDLMNHGDTSLKYRTPSDKEPEDHWFCLIHRFSTSVILALAYGKRIPTVLNNPELHKINDIMDNITKICQPGFYLADTLPILRKLPDFLAPWRIEARKMHLWEMELYGGYLNDLKTEILRGSKTECYVASHLKQRAESGHTDASGLGVTDDGWLRDTILAYAAGTLLEGGSVTTSIVLRSFVLFMLNHPHVLLKAREEVDRVVGPNRLPHFEDELQLPYVTACIKECLRCRPPGPLVSHALDEDDSWNGHFIPKGSVVVGNTWAIHMDPVRYPNPTLFNPDRFLVNKDMMARDHYAFGWGRRFCPGSFIAQASLFIAISRILWGIELQAPIDPLTGMSIIPDAADEETYSEGLVHGPRLFNVKFQPRSAKHADIIRTSFKDAQTVFESLGLANLSVDQPDSIPAEHN